MWVNFEYLDNPFVGQYFKAGCDVIAFTMATLKVHKKNLQISVFNPFYCIFGKLPKFFNFSGGMAKSYSVELKLYRKSSPGKSHLFNYKKLY